MRSMPLVLTLAALASLGGSLPLAGQQAVGEAAEPYPLEVRVWLDRGTEPVLARGDRVRIYYRTSEDAWVAIFHVDTDGQVRLLFPRTPDENHLVAGGRDYRLLFPQSSYWYVDEYEGKGYFFALASPTPFDFSGLRYAAYEKSWDLSTVGRTVYQDPYLAMDEYVATLLPEWETTPYALDFISYDVGAAHEYPRFLCYDCHGFRTFASWNPYSYACSSFRVVVWDDPYFYPAYRYGPTRVVFTSPPRGRVRFEFKERVEGEAWSPLRRTRQPAQRRTVEYLEPSAAEPDRPVRVPTRRRVVPAADATDRPGARGNAASARPAERRPATAPGAIAAPRRPAGDATPARPSPERPSTRAVRPGSQAGQERPVLQRRPARPGPSVGSGADPRRPGGAATPARPSTPTRILRPPGSVRPGEGGGAASPRTPTRGGARVVRPPSSRPTVRPPSRPSARPTVRPKPGGSSARPVPRPTPRPRPTPPKRPPPKRPGGG